MRNRETARLSIPVLTSQPYYPQSPVLCGIVPNHKGNLTLKELGLFLLLRIRSAHLEILGLPTGGAY